MATHVVIMALNNNEPHLRRSHEFKSTIRCFDDADARRRGLIPLFLTGVALAPLADAASAKPGETVVRSAAARAGRIAAQQRLELLLELLDLHLGLGGARPVSLLELLLRLHLKLLLQGRGGHPMGKRP